MGSASLKEFQDLEDQWAEIVVAQDLKAAADFLAEDFQLSSIGGVSARAARAEWLETLPLISTRSLQATVGEVRPFGDAVLVSARLRWEAQLGERDLSGDYAIVDVFTRDEGRWRASWRISVRLPTGHPL